MAPAHPHIVIIGAGPAGLAAAATFAQRGCAVEVHERRPHPPDPTAEHAHSFTIVLNGKGIQALNASGADTAARMARFPLHACVRHSPDGKYHQAFLEPRPGEVFAIERSELTLWLYETVRAKHPSVKFVFNSACHGLDLAKQEVYVGPPLKPAAAKDKEKDKGKAKGAAGGPVSPAAMMDPEVPLERVGTKSMVKSVSAKAIKYDLLVAADGASSAVRLHMRALQPERFDFSRRAVPLLYKRFRGLQYTPMLMGKYDDKGSVLNFFPAKLRPPSSEAAAAAAAAAAPAANGSSAAHASPAALAAAVAAGAVGNGSSAPSPVVASPRSPAPKASRSASQTTAPAAPGTPTLATPAASTRTSPARGRPSPGPSTFSSPSVPAATPSASASPVKAPLGSTAQPGSLAAAAPQQPAGAAKAAAAAPKRAPMAFLSVINNVDGLISGGLSIPEYFQDRLACLEDYSSLLEHIPMPDSTRQAMASQLWSAPWTWAGSWVRCSSLHGPRVVLVGDAGHAVSPSLGQGCNASLEDVTVLQQVLDGLLADAAAPASPAGSATAPSPLASKHNTSTGNLSSISKASSGSGSSSSSSATPLAASPAALSAALEKLPEAFTAARLPDVHALVWLDEHAAAFRGQLGMWNKYVAMYTAHMYCRSVLHRLAPRLVDKPALQVVWESPMPYTSIVEQLQGDGATFLRAAAAGGVLSAATCVLALGSIAVAWGARSAARR